MNCNCDLCRESRHAQTAIKHANLEACLLAAAERVKMLATDPNAGKPLQKAREALRVSAFNLAAVYFPARDRA